MRNRKTNNRRTRKTRGQMTRNRKSGGGKNNFSQNTQTRALEKYKTSQKSKFTLKKAATAAALGALAIGGPKLAYNAWKARPTTSTINTNTKSNYKTISQKYNILPYSDPTCKSYRKWISQLNTISNSNTFSYNPINQSRINPGAMVFCNTPDRIRRNLGMAEKVMYKVQERMNRPDNRNAKIIATAPLQNDIVQLQNAYYDFFLLPSEEE